MPVLQSNPTVPLDEPHDCGWVVIQPDGSPHSFRLKWRSEDWYAATRAIRSWERQGLVDAYNAEVMIRRVMRKAKADGVFAPLTPAALSQVFGPEAQAVDAVFSLFGARG